MSQLKAGGVESDVASDECRVPSLPAVRQPRVICLSPPCFNGNFILTARKSFARRANVTFLHCHCCELSDRGSSEGRWGLTAVMLFTE